MQIITIMKRHLTPVRKAVRENETRRWRQRNSYTLLEGTANVKHSKMLPSKAKDGTTTCAALPLLVYIQRKWSQ
jgi:hypothetical protein